jgi:hypothetical protein
MIKLFTFPNKPIIPDKVAVFDDKELMTNSQMFSILSNVVRRYKTKPVILNRLSDIEVEALQKLLVEYLKR